MPFPLIAMAVKKLATKGAEKGASKVAEKGAQKAATKGVEKSAQKGTQNFAQKGMQQFGKFEKENWKSHQKGKENGGEEDSKYESTFSSPPKFHKGGRVKKSGLAELKKNEVVLTGKQAYELSKKKIGGKAVMGLRKGSKAKKSRKKYVSAKR
jgi:hypothetical protein